MVTKEVLQINRGVTTPPRPSPARGASRPLSSGVRDSRPSAFFPLPSLEAFGSLQARQGAVSSLRCGPHLPLDTPSVPALRTPWEAQVQLSTIGHTWSASRTRICDQQPLGTNPARRPQLSVTNKKATGRWPFICLTLCPAVFPFVTTDRQFPRSVFFQPGR